MHVILLAAHVVLDAGEEVTWLLRSRGLQGLVYAELGLHVGLFGLGEEEEVSACYLRRN